MENNEPVSTGQQVLLNSTVSIQDNQLRHVASQMPDMPENIITSLTHADTNMTSQGSIIITNDGIVFSTGNMMMSSDVEEKNQSLKGSRNDIHDSTNNDCGDNCEFDIKVESNALQNAGFTSTSKDNQTYSIDQSVLETISDTDADLQQITFTDGDHLPQFQMQLPLSIANVQHLQNINKNVFFSQAALPEDSKETDNIQDNSSVDSAKQEANKYLTNQTFIKPESSNVSVQQQLLVKTSMENNTLKSETLLATVNSNNPVDSHINTYPQIVYVQVEGDQQQLVPLSVLPTPVSTVSGSLKRDKQDDDNDTKRKRKRFSKLLPKDAPKDVDKLRSLAPQLLSLPLYAGAQASIGAGKALLKPYDLAAVNLVEGGQYFEVLGRCTQCFRFSRTTSYCRAEKNHREPKSNVCLECEFNGLSTVVCRRKLNHLTPNAQPLNIVINTALQNSEQVKQLCIRNMLPPCFALLHSIVIHHADITFVGNKCKPDDMNTQKTLPPIPRKSTDYARGYLYPYSKERWEDWLSRFCQQTGTPFRVRTGKRVNKKTDHGLANHNGKVTSYRTLETQLYNCALGGKPRKRKPKDGIKKRKERGSRLMGCPAVIHTRLIETELQWRALEITVPKISAHLSCHDPRLVPGNVFAYEDLLLDNTNASHLQSTSNVDDDNSHQEQNQQNRVLQDTLTLNQHNSDIQQNNTAEFGDQKIDNGLNDLKSDSKTILLTCVSLLDSLNNIESMQCLQSSAQNLLTFIVTEAHKQQTAAAAAGMKDTKNDSGVVIDIDLTSSPQLETIVE